MTQNEFIFGILWLIAVTSLAASSIIYFQLQRSLIRHFGPSFPVALIAINLLSILLTFILLYSYHG
jgi:hypothetical protein